MAKDEKSVRAIAAAVKAEDLPWQAGTTDLTGLPPDQQRAHLGLVVTEDEEQQLAAEFAAAAAGEQREFRGEAFGAPTQVDWRNNGGNYVTPVKNQLSCGSCVSFCTCAVIESAVRIKFGNPSYAIDLSEGFLQFCGGGSCGGWGLTSGLDYAKSTGTVDEACMPYQLQGTFPNQFMNCNSRCSDWQNRLTKISSYAGHATMDARKTAIASKGPLLAGMAVYNDFYAYKTGVYVKTSSATYEGLHCITVVGYDDTQQCWILKNSWGANWGDGGFCRLKYGQADIRIDSSFMMYSVVPQVQAGWLGNVVITQTYASRDSQNAWVYLQGYGWRKIQPGTRDGITNMLALFAFARSKGKQVTVYADGDFVYQAYML
jgi:C1A family cysteine protease